jgi:hypothetical protein
MIGFQESNIPPGRVSYELRRLRLHGLIKRIEGTHRYPLTPEGLRTVLFYQRTYARIIRPGLSVIPSTSCRQDLPMVRASNTPVPRQELPPNEWFTIESIVRDLDRRQRF